MLKVKNLCLKTTQGQVLLEPISFNLEKGDSLVILGESGAGKSLLLQAIIGNLPQGIKATGEIYYNDLNILTLCKKELKEIWGNIFTTIPQEPWESVHPMIVNHKQISEVYEDVHNLNKADAKTQTNAMLEKVGLTLQDGEKYPLELSGGMLQRLAVAISYSSDGNVIIADEPTKGLDTDKKDLLVSLFKNKIEEKIAIIVTHDIYIAEKLANKVIVMKDRNIIEHGDLTILQNSKQDYTKELIKSLPKNWQETKVTPSDKVLVSLSSVSKSFGDNEIYKNISFDIKQKEIVGVFGESGSGKSTLGNIITRLEKPTSGSVKYNIAKNKALKIYQEPASIFPQNVSLGTLLDDLIKQHNIDETNINPLIKGLKLNRQILDRKTQNVSGGELQRFSILRAILLKPDLIFADEPTSRLDFMTSKTIIGLLFDIVKDFGCSLLIVDHDKHLLEKISNKIIVL